MFTLESLPIAAIDKGNKIRASALGGGWIMHTDIMFSMALYVGMASVMPMSD